MSAPLRAEQFRALFPALTDTVHLASCSQGAASTRLLAALHEFTYSMRSKGAPWETWMGQVEEARRRFARRIGAQPEEVAVVCCASEGAFQVASGLDWSRRPTILTTDAEFPSVAHVWLAQGGRGAEVRFVPAAGPGLEADDYAERLDETVGLVSVPLVRYANGARLPVPEVAKVARDRGARVFVDAYQGAGVLPVDVRALDCDYLVAGSLKYMLGVPGIAFLYVRGGLDHPRRPELTGWFGRRDPFAFDPRTLDFADDARRYETGTPAIPAAYAANAGMEVLDLVEARQVFEHVAGLVDDLGGRLAADGERLLNPTDAARRGPMVALADDDPPRLAGWLAERRIVTAPRGRALRLSFHYYNDASDVDAVHGAIRAYRQAHPLPR